MAVKTFGTEALTSADTNTYLANSGLVYVKSQTVGSGVSTVTVSSAFSADYDNYKIVYTGGTATNAVAIQMQLGASATQYYMGLIYVTYATGTVSTVVSNNATAWSHSGEGAPNFTTANIELLNPFLAKYTNMSATYAGTVAGTVAGYHGVATSYSSFTFIVGGNTLTGGTITVYGYRKA